MDTQNIESLANIITSTNSCLKIIADRIYDLSSNPWTIVGAIANFSLALVAIYQANKNSIHEWLFKPEIQINKSAFSASQDQNTLLISRLMINNVKKPIAKNTSFCVEKVRYYKNEIWVDATNFIPFPLKWTHLNDIYSRDLFLKRPYFLDLCEIKRNQNNATGGENLNFHLCALHRGPKFHSLDDLKEGINRIKLTLYCENHSIKHYYVDIDWDGTFCHPKIEVNEYFMQEIESNYGIKP